MYLTSRGEELGYWRKANAIHAWFVTHVQSGQDDCGEYLVTTDQLRELKTLCEKVIAASNFVPGNLHTGDMWSPSTGMQRLTAPGLIVEDPSVALELLPTTSGFFFGNTDYDERYIRQLQHTIAVINRALLCTSPVYYSSSW